ncbi:flagellar biosynthesis protein FlhA [Salmonella enterica subsp. enterica]|uniref:Flagellar biosynthesis protein FlhA n=1 Tax=Salmonella enterica I TaxID=59201 RepID=A0A447PLJ2_SALET|nr:flagellar biosynthesis protein FlhA [Salmonella enterica subsp. enterica]
MEEKAPEEPQPVKMPENNSVVEATWNDVQLEDSLGMEVGYRLIPMVDFQTGWRIARTYSQYS